MKSASLFRVLTMTIAVMLSAPQIVLAQGMMLPGGACGPMGITGSILAVVTIIALTLALLSTAYFFYQKGKSLRRT